MTDALATVSVRVDFDADTDPGVVAVLLDLLAGARVRATWIVPTDAEQALLDRLFFSGQDAIAGEPSTTRTRLAGDPHGWLQDFHVAIGDALEHRTPVELPIDTGALGASANVAVVAEALDLVAGLVRAGRVQLR